MEKVIVCVTSLLTFDFLARSVTVNPSNSVLYLCSSVDVLIIIFSCAFIYIVSFFLSKGVHEVKKTISNTTTYEPGAPLVVPVKTFQWPYYEWRIREKMRVSVRTLHCRTPTLVGTRKLIISPVEPNIIVHKLIFISSIERLGVKCLVDLFKRTRISSIHSLNTHKGTVRCQGKILTVQKKSKHV